MELEKAKWSTSYINDLPDVAFAYIESGGKKDSDGKTVPRSLRHLPHHNKSVKNASEKDSVDLPHLRNALARVSQTDISDAAKAKAEKHLKMHAKQWEIGEFAKQQVEKGFWKGILNG